MSKAVKGNPEYDLKLKQAAERVYRMASSKKLASKKPAELAGTIAETASAIEVLRLLAKKARGADRYILHRACVDVDRAIAWLFSGRRADLGPRCQVQPAERQGRAGDALACQVAFPERRQQAGEGEVPAPRHGAGQAQRPSPQSRVTDGPLYLLDGRHVLTAGEAASYIAKGYGHRLRRITREQAREHEDDEGLIRLYLDDDHED